MSEDGLATAKLMLNQFFTRHTNVLLLQLLQLIELSTSASRDVSRVSIHHTGFHDLVFPARQHCSNVELIFT